MLDESSLKQMKVAGLPQPFERRDLVIERYSELQARVGVRAVDQHRACAALSVVAPPGKRLGIGFTSIDHAAANGRDSCTHVATGSFDDALTATARKEIRMKVFIIGIGGGVGRRVAQQLMNLGHQVDGFVRNPKKGADLAKSGISSTVGDIVKMSVSEIASALSGSDAIVFSAGAGGPDSAEATKQVDGDGPLKLAAAAKEAKVERFVLVSVFPEAWRERQMPKDFELYMAEKKKAECKRRRFPHARSVPLLKSRCSVLMSSHRRRYRGALGIRQSLKWRTKPVDRAASIRTCEAADLSE